MSIEYVVMIVVPIITGLFGFLSQRMDLFSKREDSSHKRIEFIVSFLENANEKCNNELRRMTDENSKLRSKVRDLNRVINNLSKGGE
ncbi:hypothetical protein AALF85_02700 [Jeotgalicoccus halotolerans]|uniref:hypothetical protein n=1 Tax=Jeotgalicoccus halotolerans TaxID=157227 RepID=UPI003511F759